MFVCAYCRRPLQKGKEKTKGICTDCDKEQTQELSKWFTNKEEGKENGKY